MNEYFHFCCFALLFCNLVLVGKESFLKQSFYRIKKFALVFLQLILNNIESTTPAADKF